MTIAGHPEPAVDYGVEITGLVKAFESKSGTGRVLAVDHVDLHVPAGEFWVLLGPSGCGKTTLLRSLAGLEQPDEGTISISGREVFRAGHRSELTQSRQVGMVFQNYALWPHMTVAQNVSYPLFTVPRGQRLARPKIKARVQELLDLMGLSTLGDRRIGQLSGGQQQRVALARAIAVGNRVVLFDEPLSNIDAKVREQLRRDLRLLQRELGFTGIYVTHDQGEAMEMADKIAVMREGKVIQVGTSEEVYWNPQTQYVAEFIGTSNIFDGTVSSRTPSSTVVATRLGDIVSAGTDHPESSTGEVLVSSRAQSWWISPEQTETTNRWQGKVVTHTFLGSHTEFVVQIADTTVRIWQDRQTDRSRIEDGDTVWCGVAAGDIALIAD